MSSLVVGDHRRGGSSCSFRNCPVASCVATARAPGVLSRRACPSVTKHIPSPVALVEARWPLEYRSVESPRTPGSPNPGVGEGLALERGLLPRHRVAGDLCAGG